MGVLIFVISWLMVGFICMIAVWAYAMRGEEFDPDFFDNEETITTSIMLLLFGYISLGIVLAFFTHDKRYFTRLIYKIANIGVKKDKTSKEE